MAAALHRWRLASAAGATARRPVLRAALLPSSARAQAQPSPKLPPAAPISTKDRVLRYACALGAPPSLVLGIAEQESQFGSGSLRGAAGELGVMQVEPDTARAHGLNPEKLMDVDYGIYAGIVVLFDIMRDFGDEQIAIGVYNGGSGYATNSLNPAARWNVTRYIEAVLRRKSKYAGYDCTTLS